MSWWPAPAAASTAGGSSHIRAAQAQAFSRRIRFSQGELVTASALVGPRGHSERLSTSFTIARLSRYRPPSAGAPAPAKAGATQSFVSQPALHPPKDPWGDGNLILSARNTWAAYEISHLSGAVLWRLGGKRSSFKMGSGTGTAWQHDVRWQPDYTLTIFDNGAVPRVHSQLRVIHERIDWAHRKVTLVGRDVRTPALLTGSQGDDQLLSDGDSFVGWGEEPYFTEFGPTGQILFEGRIPYPGQSYRAFRFPWSATPAARPAVAVISKAGRRRCMRVGTGLPA
jgi:hypothetical protein